MMLALIAILVLHHAPYRGQLVVLEGHDMFQYETHLRVLDLGTGSLKTMIFGDVGDVNSIVPSTSGNLLLINDDIVRIDLRSAHGRVGERSGLQGIRFASGALSALGRYPVVMEHQIGLLDLAKKNVRVVRKLSPEDRQWNPAHDIFWFSAAWIDDQHLIASYVEDDQAARPQLILVDLRSQSRDSVLGDGGQAKVAPLQRRIAFIRFGDGRGVTKLVTAELDRQGRLRKQIYVAERVVAFTFDHSGEFLAYATWNGRSNALAVNIYRISRREVVRSIRLDQEEGNWIMDMAWTY